MIYRNKNDVEGIQWGNGQSYRLLTAKDKMGFSICHTIVNAGSKSNLEYCHHLESCYCISGSGQVISSDKKNIYDIQPGSLYALNKNDAHTLIADECEDMHLISVFNPPLTGKEKHQLDSDGFSHY